MKLARITILAATVGLTLGTAAVQAQTIAMATDKQGTTFNTVGSGVAKVVSQNSGLNVIVRPYAGPAAWAPIVNNGEVPFGMMSANSAFQAFSGENEAGKAYRDLRVIRAGGASLMLGFAVRADGPIKSYADLKGARVSSDFGGHLSINNSLTASLKVAGYTWDDVTEVPVSGANDGLDALVADRLDATWASVGQPRAREADTQIGVRYLSVPETGEEAAIYQEIVFPGARMAVAQDGVAPGIVGPTRLLSYDSYLVSASAASDQMVTDMLQALWDHSDDLFDVHPSMRGFTNDNAVTNAPVMPYHPAAVAFYKSKGVWTDEDQARQDKLLAAAAS
ncbi:TAXI family TRAP transporter solute-binding subunit [Puniceibacterium sp. IMCC21224]|uniref:TAXI family TRAP transporter solute-binding subunit n=1 Tax=Puniceibacterium sp. IMCC21224 TaxID=1618204 RepID=UPI00064DEAC8|nr:TAXI family TRAP transporter solute-binding subunit [Puniceibacterium sp. IMCC21224]KMK68491.1 TRAP transporter solute receptor, TAXI family [Puniceibacterium sp. IMCC21224]